jgi:hypothetical protein
MAAFEIAIRCAVSSSVSLSMNIPSPLSNANLLDTFSEQRLSISSSTLVSYLMSIEPLRIFFHLLKSPSTP